MTLRLTKLRLRNVRSYESAELDFGPGVTVLLGDVGSGKTSLFHAIEMALFGFAEVEAPYLVRHKSGVASVSLTLADDDHSYELARTFRRKTRRGREVFEPEEPTFRVDGELRTYSATEFRQRVIELLGFPDNPNPRSRSDLWRWAVYTPQERMRDVLREDEAEARLETIRKALDLERYRLAADNAELLATALRARARTHTDVARGLQHFEADLAKAEADLGTAGTALARAEAAAADARRAAAEAEELLAASEAERRRREADEREAEQQRTEEARLVSAVAASERRWSEAEAVAAKSRGLAEALTDLGPERARASQAATEADGAYEARRTELAELEAASRERLEAAGQLAAIQRSLEAVDGELATNRAELARAESDGSEAEHRGPVREPVPPTPRGLEELGSALEAQRQQEREALQGSGRRLVELRELTELVEGNVCPRCHQAVRPEEFAVHRSEAAAAAEDAARALRTVQELLAATEGERASRERFERVHQTWLATQELRARAKGAVDRARQRVASSEANRVELAARLAVAEGTERVARERAAPYETARAEIRAAERRREEARDALAGLERRAASAESIRAAATSSGALAITEADRLSEERARLGQVRTALERLEPSLRGAAEAARAHGELLARRDAARRLERSSADSATSARERRSFAEQRAAAARDGVGERRLHLDRSERLTRLAAFVSSPYRDALLDLERRLLGRAQATLERSFSRAFSTLVEDPGLTARCGPSFVPFVEIDGEWTPAEALSGGERTALALAFRVALGDVVRASGRLRLDTILLDEPTDGFSPEQVVRMGELLRSLPWGQVLVVTHEASLAGVGDRSVRVRKDAGVSRLEGDLVPATPPGVPTPGPGRRRNAATVDVLAPPAT